MQKSSIFEGKVTEGDVQYLLRGYVIQLIHDYIKKMKTERQKKEQRRENELLKQEKEERREKGRLMGGERIIIDDDWQ